MQARAIRRTDGKLGPCRIVPPLVRLDAPVPQVDTACLGDPVSSEATGEVPVNERRCGGGPADVGRRPTGRLTARPPSPVPSGDAGLP